MHDVFYEFIRLGQQYPPASIDISFTRHASPRRRGADTFAEAIQKNEAIAEDRVLYTRQISPTRHWMPPSGQNWQRSWSRSTSSIPMPQSQLKISAPRKDSQKLMILTATIHDSGE